MTWDGPWDLITTQTTKKKWWVFLNLHKPPRCSYTNIAPPWIPSEWKQIKHGQISRYLGIPFEVDVSLFEMWRWFLNKMRGNFLTWENKFLSMVGKIQVINRIFLASHVYYSSCWMPSKKAYDDFIKLVRHFIWSNWSGNAGFKCTFGLNCIQPKAKGGLGILDPKTQGVCLAAKWIILAISRNAPWKILVHFHISQGSVQSKWQIMTWEDKLLLAPFFNIQVFASLQSIWKAW